VSIAVTQTAADIARLSATMCYKSHARKAD